MHKFTPNRINEIQQIYNYRKMYKILHAIQSIQRSVESGLLGKVSHGNFIYKTRVRIPEKEGKNCRSVIFMMVA